MTLPKKRKLSYKDQRELDALPKKIEQLEISIDDIHKELADPDTYQKDPQHVAKIQDKLAEFEAELQQAYQQWEALED